MTEPRCLGVNSYEHWHGECPHHYDAEADDYCEACGDAPCSCDADYDRAQDDEMEARDD